jgi:hypothetical protein
MTSKKNPKSKTQMTNKFQTQISKLNPDMSVNLVIEHW